MKNKGKNRAIGKVVMGDEPKLTVRIIGKCNFRCPSCSTFSYPERKGKIRFSDFKKVVDILASEHFRGVVNISGGEPTLHRDLVKMVGYTSRKLPNSKIVTFTNGHWIGRPGWVEKLRHLLAGDNIMVRFSLDRQHAEGAILATNSSLSEKQVRKIELLRFEKARHFLQACSAEKAIPGKNFDFAYKGSEQEAKNYMSKLGPVPVYTIRFRKDPSHRPEEMGFFAVEIDQSNQVLVYKTLGHIISGDFLGGIGKLPEALRLNRMALKTK
jgi:uncharacterized Fe-S cluster-containing radical SAM superfamily protein